MEHDIKRSIELMEKGFVEHEDGNLFVQLAEAYRAAGDLERAMRVLRRGLEKHPTYVPGYALLGIVLRDLGREAEAAVCFEQLLEMDPSNPVARASLAEIPAALARGRSSARGTATGIANGRSGSAAARPVARLSAAAESASEPYVADAGFARPDAGFARPDAGFARPDTRPDEGLRPAWGRSAWSAGVRPRLHGDPPVNGSGARVEAGYRNGASDHAHAAGESAAVQPRRAPVDLHPPQQDRTGDDSMAVELADLLVGFLEFRDPFFRGGTSMTRLLGAAIARQLGVDEATVKEISLGAVLRDVGQIPLKGFIERAGTELDADGRRQLARHVDTSLELLSAIRLPRVALDTVRHHHEWWDGRGYPDGLTGDRIPLGARIVSVADSLAAMIAARPHRLPMRVRDAVDDIHSRSGKQYDPAVVEALVQVLTGTSWRGLPFGLRHRILVVDPDDTRAMVMATKLCSNGYLAETASSAETARERLLHTRIVGLVISAELPEGGDGSLVRAVRDVERHAMIPIVLTETAPTQRAALLDAGADVCLVPGSEFSEMKATIEAFLRREGGPLAAGGRSEALWAGLQGDLEEFPLSWLLQVLNYDTRTAAVFIAGKGDAGAIYLDAGNPRHAQTMSLKGEEALRAMLRWSTGSFSVDPDTTTDEESIRLPLMKLLLDDAVQDDHADFFGAVKVT